MDGGIIYTTGADIYAFASATASAGGIFVSGGSVTGLVSVSCAGERLGENWTDETFGSNTWVDVPSDTNIWVQTQQDDNTWTDIPDGSNVWTQVPQENNTWLRQG
jgi:hypothetical protein